MDFKTLTFENGLTLLLVNDARCPSVTVMSIYRVGSRNEDEIQSGIAHLIEHNLFKGTELRPSSKLISYDVENLGAYQNAYTGKEATSYYIKGPKDNVREMVEILADMLTNSIFPEKEFEKEKKVIIEEIKMYEDHPQSKLYRLYLRELFKGNQLAEDIAGSVKSVSQLTIEQCKKFMKDYYHPNNMILVVSGDFKEEVVVEQIKKIFGNMKQEKIEAPQKFPTVKLNGKIKQFSKKIEQTHIILGGYAPGSYLTHKENIPFRLGVTIMSGGMGARLSQRIREDLGIAYYVDMGYQTYSEVGHYYVNLGVDHSRVEEAINAVLEELKVLKEGGISDQEFARAKNYTIGMMTTAFETSSDLASWYGSQLVKKQELISAEEIIELIKQTTKEDVIKSWSKWLSEENLQIVTYGKKMQDMSLVKI